MLTSDAEEGDRAPAVNELNLSRAGISPKEEQALVFVHFVLRENETGEMGFLLLERQWNGWRVVDQEIGPAIVM